MDVDVHIGQHALLSCPSCASAICLRLVRQVLATEVEQEEEYLVNNLQKRMGKLNLEKTELEKELEKLHRKARATIQQHEMPLSMAISFHVTLTQNTG